MYLVVVFALICTPYGAAASGMFDGQDAPPLSLNAFVDSAIDGTVTLPPGTYLASDIPVDSHLRIVGSGAQRTVIQPSSDVQGATTRLFSVGGSGTLELCSLTLRGGNASHHPRRGGAVQNLGRLHAESVVFAENRALYGGAIWSRGVAEFVDCVFEYNTTLAPTTAEILDGTGCMGAGGAIKTEAAGSVVVRRCDFVRNESLRSRGGALFVACHTEADVRDTLFAENVAHDSGGAISVRGDAAIADCTIVRNRAGDPGGGVFNYGRVAMDSTIVVENWPDNVALGSGGMGMYGHGAFVGSPDGTDPLAASSDVLVDTSARVGRLRRTRTGRWKIRVSD